MGSSKLLGGLYLPNHSLLLPMAAEHLEPEYSVDCFSFFVVCLFVSLLLLFPPHFSHPYPTKSLNSDVVSVLTHSSTVS